jgi:hypothetical protein
MDLDDRPKSMRDEIKSSHENNESPIAKLITSIEIQDAHIVHHYPNFFVLAPSFKKREALIALEEMEADTIKSSTVCLEDMTSRSTYIPPEDALDAAVEAAVQEAEAIVECGLAKDTVEDELVEETTIPDTSPLEHKELEASRNAPVAVASEQPGIIASISAWKIPNWLETILIIGILAVSGVAHAINMFNYPHYDQDEGTYMMYAWAVTRGMLSPYAYGYGHPPLGWIQIAAWTRLTGGFYAFGNALNSGRVLMLLYAVACTLLVYLIARHLEASFVIRLLAIGIFIFSPLSITFQREVLLDNFAAFWFLLSLPDSSRQESSVLHNRGRRQLRHLSAFKRGHHCLLSHLDLCGMAEHDQIPA